MAHDAWMPPASKRSKIRGIARRPPSSFVRYACDAGVVVDPPVLLEVEGNHEGRLTHRYDPAPGMA